MLRIMTCITWPLTSYTPKCLPAGSVLHIASILIIQRRFWGCSPPGATRWTKEGETYRGGRNLAWRATPRQISYPSVYDGVWNISEYERHAESYPLNDFCEIFWIYGQFHVRLTIQIWREGFAQAVSELCWFKFRNVFFPKALASPSGKTVRRIADVSDVQEWYWSPLSPCQVWWSVVFAGRQGAKKFDVFLLCFCP